MADFETFLTEVYVMVDNALPTDTRGDPRCPGPPAQLAPSETVTLALLSQLRRFRSGRDFYRFAEARLRPFFPTLPHRTQWLRQVRRLAATVAAVAVRLGAALAGDAPFEVIDCTVMPTRNAKRRGRGWLPGVMDIGYSNRIGFYEGAKVLTCVGPTGVLTGLGMGPASANDRPLAETLFAQRTRPVPALPGAGRALSGTYLSDQGFGGRAYEARSAADYRVTLVCPPQPDRRTRIWPKALRRWLIGLRQIVESVHANLVLTTRFETNRPHSLAGALSNLASIAALHNVCIAYNRRHGRPDLATAEVVGW